MFDKIIKYLKEDKWYIIFLIFIFLICNYRLPYYVNMPGGTININDRIECAECSDINGSLNMLYVTEYVATIPVYLMSYIIPNWDRESIHVQQINNESVEEINMRNKLLLENSIDSAMYVAYTEANKSISVSDKKTFVVTTLFDNNLCVGDEILEVNDNKIVDVLDIKKIIKSSLVGDILKFKIKRNGKVMFVSVVVKEENKENIIGVIIITDYVYDINPNINIKFKSAESGSSGGLMMALSIYTRISNNDIVKGRKVAGTGTISNDGMVGEIDGIKYKIMGAVRNKMDIVLVPSGNYNEALKVVNDNNYDIILVKVKTFQDAINYLKNN